MSERWINGLGWLGAALLAAGCHVATAAHIPAVDPSRASDPALLAEAPQRIIPINDAANDRLDTAFRISAPSAQAAAELDYAVVRAVPGSACRVSRAAICSSEGTCIANVEMVGTVCVLLVRAIAQSGEELAPYCHDLSHPEWQRGATPVSGKKHPAWDRCLDHVESAAESRTL